MLEIFFTVVFLVTGFADGLAQLDPTAVALARPGDAAVLYRLEPGADGKQQWLELGPSRVVDSGHGLAVVWSGPEATESALRVVVRVPAKRVGIPAQPPAPETDLRAKPDRELAAAVERLIPTDERVELAVLALLERRWGAREAASEPASASDPASPQIPTAVAPLAMESAAGDKPGDIAGEAMPATPDAQLAPDAQERPSDAELAHRPKAQVGAHDLVPVRVEIQPVDSAGPPRDVAAAGIEPAPVAELPAAEEPPSIGITARVRAWAAARAGRRAEEVLGFYASAFQPEGDGDRTQWTSALRRSLAQDSPRSIQLDDLDAGFEGSLERARVEFTERQTVDGVAQAPRRLRLVLVWERQDWYILEQTVLPTLPVPASPP